MLEKRSPTTRIGKLRCLSRRPCAVPGPDPSQRARHPNPLLLRPSASVTQAALHEATHSRNSSFSSEVAGGPRKATEVDGQPGVIDTTYPRRRLRRNGDGGAGRIRIDTRRGAATISGLVSPALTIRARSQPRPDRDLPLEYRVEVTSPRRTSLGNATWQDRCSRRPSCTGRTRRRRRSDSARRTERSWCTARTYPGPCRTELPCPRSRDRRGTGRTCPRGRSTSACPPDIRSPAHTRRIAPSAPANAGSFGCRQVEGPGGGRVGLGLVTNTARGFDRRSTRERVLTAVDVVREARIIS